MNKSLDIMLLVDDMHKVVDKTLYSLAYQTKIDKANVYLINNATGIDYKKEIDFFSNFTKIEEIKIKKKLNSGKAFQYAIDKTNSKYIMFLNTNGIFISPIVIEQMENTIKKTKSNVVLSNIKSENNDNRTNSKAISLYGKIYERKFIDNNKIMFHDSKTSEEVGFNMQVYLCNAKVEQIQDETYLELKDLSNENNPKTYNEYYNIIFEYIDNMVYALKMAVKNKCNKEQISYFAFHTIISAYYFYVEINDKKFRDMIINSTKEILNAYKKNPISKDKENQIWYNEFFMLSQNVSASKKLNSSISLEDFLKMY